ncbi:hypothetical protein ACRAKI_15040 [Saccharothrix isguenensis]
MPGPAHRVAGVPGDVIGAEVIAAAIEVLDAVSAAQGIALPFAESDWSCGRYRAEGR